MNKSNQINAIVLIFALSYSLVSSAYAQEGIAWDSSLNNVECPAEEICYSTQAHSSFIATTLIANSVPASLLWLFTLNAAHSQFIIAHEIKKGHVMANEYTPTSLVTAAFMIKWLQQISNHSFEEIAELLSIAASDYSALLAEQLPMGAHAAKFLAQAETVLNKMQIAQTSEDGHSILTAARTCVHAAAFALTLSENQTKHILTKFNDICVAAFGPNGPKCIPAMQAQYLSDIRLSMWGNISDDICKRAQETLIANVPDLYAQGSAWASLHNAIAKQFNNSSLYRKSVKIGAVSIELYNKLQGSLNDPWKILEILAAKNGHKVPSYLILLSLQRVLGLYSSHMQLSANMQTIEKLEASMAYCTEIKEQFGMLKPLQSPPKEYSYYKLMRYTDQCPGNSTHLSLEIFEPAEERETHSLDALEHFTGQALQEAQWNYWFNLGIYALNWSRLNSFVIKSIGILEELQPITNAIDRTAPAAAILLTFPKFIYQIQAGWASGQMQEDATTLSSNYTSDLNSQELKNAELAAIAKAIADAQRPYWHYIGMVVEALKQIRLLLCSALSFNLVEYSYAIAMRNEPQVRVSVWATQGALVAALNLLNYFLAVGSISLDVAEDIELQQRNYQKKLLLEALKKGDLVDEQDSGYESYKEAEQEVLEELLGSSGLSSPQLPKEAIQEMVAIKLALELISNDSDFAMDSLVNHWIKDRNSGRRFLKALRIQDKDLNAMEHSLSRKADVVTRLKQLLRV